MAFKIYWVVSNILAGLPILLFGLVLAGSASGGREGGFGIAALLAILLLTFLPLGLNALIANLVAVIRRVRRAVAWPLLILSGGALVLAAILTATEIF